MTINQTIDGVLVSRELLERAISATMVARGPGSPTERDLRALLDAPAAEVDPIVGVLKRCLSEGVQPTFSGGDLKHLIRLLDSKPAAQPQGEPVVCSHEWTDDGEFLLVCTACGAQEDYNQALQRAFELGGTDDGRYHLEADELCEVIRLHKQPAPRASERSHGIPGTSFQRLNQLANEGE